MPGLSQSDSAADEAKDTIIAQREFERGEGMDLSSFMLSEEQVEKQPEESTVSQEKEIDEALGSLPEFFTSSEKEEDSVDPSVSLAVDAEQRVHWSMMVAMVILWSVLGAYLGVTMPAAVAGPSLLGMALLSLWLAKGWIPNAKMRILGVTWAIIAMKLLYGLALDLHHWGLLEIADISAPTMLGIVLLSLVALNIFLAQHFDEDAIAAQATLVLLAIGSATGALYGELGVALMIGLATIVLHTLAMLRDSGNLTSLGVAASNLWIGLHALSSGWNIFGLEILPFEDPLVLLLLTLFVNAANAAMATRYANRQNWFSQGASALGLGKPGLWGVSVGLGMIGALLAIVAHRDETGFALAQISILMTAFGASYLVVRGVSPNRILPGVLIPIPFLVGALVLFDTGLLQFSMLSGHALFAGAMGIVAAITILRNQEAVSDHVLWLGTLIIAVLLTLLIPADEGEQGNILLLVLAFLFAALGAFAVKRSSPSIAGVTVIAPWFWVFIFATDIENRLVSSDLLPIVLDGEMLTAFLFSMGVVQVVVNLSMGETGVDLGKAFGSGTEAVARIRDSGVLKLWSIGWFLALLGWIAVARPEGLPALGLVFGIVSLTAIHLYFQLAGRHVNQRRFLFITLAVATLWIHWRFGLTLVWPLLMVAVGTILAWDARRCEPEGHLDLENRSEPLQSLMFSFITAHLILASLDLAVIDLLHGASWPDAQTTMWAVMAGTAVALVIFLPQAGRLERPLGPAISCMVMLLSLLVWSNGEDGLAFLISGVMFAGSGLWLISQGEIRLGLASLGKAEKKKEIAEARRIAADVGIEGAQTPEEVELPSIRDDKLTGVRLIDATLVHQAAKQARRRKRSGSIGEYDLVAGDVHHLPAIVLVFVIIISLAASWWSYSKGDGEALLLVTMLLLISAILLTQKRVRNLEMRMPDFLGIEIPVAVSMAGLVLVHIAGRVSQKHVDPDSQLGLLLLGIGLSVIAAISLISRKDLALRLPSALEWVLYGLVADRITTTLLVGGVPPPFSVDPSAGTGMEWILPWVFLEILLISALLLFDLVERKRLQRGLQDHRGADGRSLWIIMVMFVSWGPATLLAAYFALLRARSWSQPGLAVSAIILIPMAWAQSTAWIPFIDGMQGHGALVVGLVCVGLLTSSVMNNEGRWSTAWLWSIHILLPCGALLISRGADALGVTALLIVSGSAWISGVLEERRSWRVVGFLDLILAWVVAGLALSTKALTSALLLPMLIASVLLLGLVTWLGQMHEERLTTD